MCIEDFEACMKKVHDDKGMAFFFNKNNTHFLKQNMVNYSFAMYLIEVYHFSKDKGVMCEQYM